MSRTRHAQLQELFLAAVDIPADEQASFLDEACDEDPTLRRDLSELLAADSQECDGALSSAATEAPDIVEGTGTYHILREIGRGGMGVVYLAERSDGAFRRRVAIKVLHHHMSSDGEIVKRFRAERQILATLDHPNIARLLDGGAMPDGSPFLVMEFVEGEPISSFVNRHALPVKARIELFLEVCQAVQAAHQSLVVHRDLKPSNVLVTEDGLPKLLDFGIAKLLDPQAIDWTMAETRLGSQPLTPRYASPEQIVDGPITTATDVYSLGVLFYELMTGRLPYRPLSSAIHHWVAAVCDQEPRRPSVTVLRDDPDSNTTRPAGNLHEISRCLSGDIDHIVLMALRKEPRQRYATAAKLAADLRRHLDGLPILARPATLPYRTGKFLRRHRWGVAVALFLALLAGGFTVGLERQLRRTEVERDKAQTVTDLLIQVFAVAGPSTIEGREPTAREVLERGLERVQAGLNDQPQVKAALLAAIGRVFNNLGRLEKAAQAHELALELRRDFREQAPLEYAESLDQLAIVLVAQAELGRAEAMYREALSVMAAEVGQHDPRTIACLDGLQQTLSKAGRHREAAELAQQVVELTLDRLGFRDADAAVTSDSTAPELTAIAMTLGSLAAEQRQMGSYTAAERSLQQALSLNRRLLGEHHFGVAFNINNLANVYSNQEKHEIAVAERGVALVIAEAVLGPDHPAVGNMCLNQGFDLHRLGLHEEALLDISRAHEIFTAALGPDHPSVAMAMSYKGRAQAGRGQLEQGFDTQKAAQQRLVISLGENHPEVAQALADLGATLHTLGRHEEAVEHYHRAAGIYEGALGAEHPDTLECWSRVTEPLLALDRPDAARANLESAVATFEARADLPRHLARARFRLARVIAFENPASLMARHLAERALATFRKEADEESTTEVTTWMASVD